MTKLTMISYSCSKGGAGISAKNFENLLIDCKSNYEVNLITQDDAGYYQFFKRLISFVLNKLQFDGNATKHSLNLFSYSPVLKTFEKTQDRLFHLHWINNDTLSVFDFNKIPSGSVVTLHDEWLYCGSEHYYKILDKNNDFIYGYPYFTKNVFGIHWNSFIWKVKYKKLSHRRDLIYTVSSKWMLERAKSSAILKESDVRLLPNPIDTNVFTPSPSNEVKSFRDILNIDNDCFIFVYGAISGKKNKLKGIDLLIMAIKLLQSKNLNIPISKIVLIDFGGSKGNCELYGFRNISLGHINDTTYLAKLYSLADCVIVPSMVESFGQIAAEALSCSTPVVSFDTSGLKDIVLNGSIGLLAKSFSVDSLCSKLHTMIEIPKETRVIMGQNGRKHIIKNFSFSVISEKYLGLLEDAAKLKKIST
tara:strand:- start:57 stop:1313 length:1257 start_codon:yes stop_codon:yes gene_type:complete